MTPTLLASLTPFEMQLGSPHCVIHKKEMKENVYGDKSDFEAVQSI